MADVSIDKQINVVSKTCPKTKIIIKPTVVYVL